jgi:hypothetical protein
MNLSLPDIPTDSKKWKVRRPMQVREEAREVRALGFSKTAEILRCEIIFDKADLVVPHRKIRTGKGTKKKPRLTQGEVDLNASGEVIILPKESLPTPPATKRIHPRRRLPLVPEAPRE